MKSQIKRSSKYSSPGLAPQQMSAVGQGSRSWSGGYAGNLATAEYLSNQAMTVSEPNDASEQEADSTAERVMRNISRSPAQGGEPGRLSRSADAVGGSSVSPGLQSGIESAQSGPAASLPARLSGSMGGAMGCTFNDVRVHNDSSSHAMSRELQADAFTRGNDIFFGKGTYQPESPDGQRLIAHELTHVAQEQSGLQRSPQGSIIRRAKKPAPAPAAPAGPLEILANPLMVRLIKLIARIKKTPIGDWATVDVGTAGKAGGILDTIGSVADITGNVADIAGAGSDLVGLNDKAENGAGIVSGTAGIVSGGAGMVSSGASFINTSMEIDDARKNRFSNKKEGLLKNKENADLTNLKKDDYEGVNNQATNAMRLAGSGTSFVSGGMNIAAGGFGMASSINGLCDDKDKKEAFGDTASGLGFASSAVGLAGTGINAAADAIDYGVAKSGRKADKAKLDKARVKVETALGSSPLEATIKDKLTAILKDTGKTAITNIKKFMEDNKTKLDDVANKPLKNSLAQYIMSLQMEHTSSKNTADKRDAMTSSLVDTGLGALSLIGSGMSSFGGDNKWVKGIGSAISAISSGISLVKNLFQAGKKTKKAATANSDSRKDKYRQRVLDVVGAMQSMPDILGAGIERADFDACAAQAGQSRNAPAPTTPASKPPKPIPLPTTASAEALSKLNALSGQITEYKDFYDNMNGTVNMLDLCTSVPKLSGDDKLEADEMKAVAGVIAGGMGL